MMSFSRSVIALTHKDLIWIFRQNGSVFMPLTKIFYVFRCEYNFLISISCKKYKIIWF